jgi:hypothetical protein
MSATVLTGNSMGCHDWESTSKRLRRMSVPCGVTKRSVRVSLVDSASSEQRVRTVRVQPGPLACLSLPIQSWMASGSMLRNGGGGARAYEPSSLGQKGRRSIGSRRAAASHRSRAVIFVARPLTAKSSRRAGLARW